MYMAILMLSTEDSRYIHAMQSTEDSRFMLSTEDVIISSSYKYLTSPEEGSFKCKILACNLFTFIKFSFFVYLQYVLIHAYFRFKVCKYFVPTCYK